MSRSEKLELLELLETKAERLKYQKIKTYFPDKGELRRELYKKHLQFFEAGKLYRERAFIAANRVGKTESGGGYEMTLHLTGNYPSWWTGRRFDRPIQAWAAGDTGKTVRDIIQYKLLGRAGEYGTGLIPKDLIVRYTNKHGLSDCVDTLFVKHATGGLSQITLKSYDQRRESFQGTEQDVIWLDEEPSIEIYTECLLRTMTNDGLIMLTFTPLMGMSETVLSFLPNGEMIESTAGSKTVVMASWEDVPHLSEEMKAELLASIPPFQRDARSKGIPQLGSGAIYPVPETEFTIADMPIPDHWPRCFGMDVGWNRTAAIWGAWDRESDTVYLYAEHYRGQAEPSIHADAIKARGDWIPGVIDPASRGRSQDDGRSLMELYGKSGLGLDIDVANNSVETGIYEVWQRLSTGRLKVFKSLTSWLQEFRLYRRDEKGKIVKTNDHIMDATRYLIMSGLERAKIKPSVVNKPKHQHFGASSGWMG